MESWRDRVINYLVLPSIGNVIFSIIGSKILTGNWLELFNRAISGDWRVIISLIILFGLISYIIKKLRETKIYGAPVVAGTTAPLGYTEIGTINYADVLWRIKAPIPSPIPSFLGSSQPSVSDVIAVSPPLCPDCKTELEQSRRCILPGYTWRCVKCGFTKNNRDSFDQERDRAERIAKSEIEKKIREGRNDSMS